ncbi:mechanosensitive ion channel domain-containing protein [Roseobacter sinensis]|uniref:Small-conductance mechanosensitive channel n=1 Tax=Roseobacter sinensis TaxID=2931391 RepID=A0ABT3BGR5_9RHOB|nr:mechanosensitive ion channel domain-containing protein [Roseobacter sp. WL0113]MCV3272763.1 mechanosensitive ion channel [Roseobacter sp. WL0113]
MVSSTVAVVRRRLAWLVVCGAVLAAGAAFDAAAQTREAPTQAEPISTEQQVDIEPVAADDRIADRIARILRATGWYRDVAVEVDEGVAFLDGVSETEAQRTWAQNLAAKTTGVVAVVNRIQVDNTVEWSFDPALAELNRLVQDTVAALPLFILAVLVLPLAWYAAKLVARLVRWLLGARVPSPFLRSVISRIVAFPVFLVGLYIVLQVAGLTQLALSLVGGAGVVGIVIGFAFRDIVENFLASLILSVRRPFQRGDFIEVAGLSGTVKSMTTRSTLLSSVEGNQIHIPNATVFKNVIENFTSSPSRRGDFVVGVGYDAAVPEVQSIVLECLQSHPAVLADPEPMVLVDELGASTVNIRTYYWYNGHIISPIKLKSALLRTVKTALMTAGVSLPDEAREVIFPQGVHVITGTEASPPPAPDEDLRTPGPPEPDATESEGDLLTETGPDEEIVTDDTEPDLLGSR